MKKIIGLLLGVMILVLMVCFYTGCGNSDNPEISLAVVVGMHSNAPDIPVNSASVKNAIYNSCYTYGAVSFITADGNPKVYYQTDIPKPETGGLTGSKKASIANGYTAQLLKEIIQASPSASEVDTLKAIQQAAKALAGSAETSDKVMVIMDSGLATTGYLDFTKGLLNADTESIVEALKQAEAIPDVNGVTVVWMFNGQTANPQPELSERQKNKLQDIWNTILTAGGAKEVVFTSDIASDHTDHDYPYVSIVDVENRNIDVDIEEGQSQMLETTILDNTTVQFVSDKAVFVDYDSVVEGIKGLAEQLLAHPDNKVYVIGTTASGGKEFCLKLSNDRAKAVTDVLISYGVPKDQLIPVGLGYEDPWHVDDLDSEGRQIEEKAAQNRKVLIVDVNGADAEKIN